MQGDAVDVGFEAYVLARGDALHRTAYLLAHDHALAEDLVQTSLARSWGSWSRIRGEPDPYVRRVMVNTYASWRRRWASSSRLDALSWKYATSCARCC